MSDPTLTTPNPRPLLVDGAAALAALGLAPQSAAVAGTRTGTATTAAAAAAGPARKPSTRVLHQWAADTWHSLDAMTDPRTGLPADNIPESLAAGDRSGYT